MLLQAFILCMWKGIQAINIFSFKKFMGHVEWWKLKFSMNQFGGNNNIAQNVMTISSFFQWVLLVTIKIALLIKSLVF